MELNYIEKFELADKSSMKGKFLTNKDKEISISYNSQQNNLNNYFHIDCKYSRKKICHCKFYDSCNNTNSNKNAIEFSDFLISLVNDKIDIETDSGNKINFSKKDKFIKYNEMKTNFYSERVKNINFDKSKECIKNFDQINLNYTDYRDIERKINEDKKICENCKTNIYENNFHRGWRNETGEYALLCSNCHKKYFNGALDMKFDNRREDIMIPVNRPLQNMNISLQSSNNNIFKIGTDNSNPPPSKNKFFII